MLEKLGSTIKSAIDKISKAIFVDKALIDEITKEIRRSLLEADVNPEITENLITKIKKEAEKPLKGAEKKEQIIKLIHDEIVEIVGGEKKELELKKPTKIMLLGLYGSGKTTTAAKLASYYSKRGKKVCLLGLDVYRPAASEQLQQLGKKLNIPVFIDKEEKLPELIHQRYKEELKKFDIIIIDTAGRDALEKELLSELKKINMKLVPDYNILVMPADIGQSAKTQVIEFKKACPIHGTIITRMDSTAKGGGALVACYETNSPVLFIGTGEKISDLETFNPTGFVSRILGMGDLNALIEKIDSIEKPDIEKGKFTLIDLYNQLKSMESLGSLGKIAELIPGLGKTKIPEELLTTQESKLKKLRHAINSMTKEEIENPEILEKETSRISRISKGSGIPTSDIKMLIAQYKLLKNFAQSEKSINSMNQENTNFSPKALQSLPKKQLKKLAKKFKVF